MKDITSLTKELKECVCELASITRESVLDDNIFTYANYIDPIRAEFLKGKIEFLQTQIDINNC